MITKDDIAFKLLLPIWRGLAADYKSKYKSSIWQQFEDNLKVASYVGSLADFLERISRHLPVTIQAKDMQDVMSIVQSGEDYEVLRTLRNELTTLVLMVRLANQDRNLSYQQSLFE